MSKQPLERRSYRKSPGRQYGYDYDPLRSQSGLTASKPDGLLVQRPDPRRTRQFLRQSIIASKRSAGEDTEPVTDRGQEGRILSTPLSVSSTHPKTTRRIRHTSQDLVAYDEQGEEVPTKRPDNRSATYPKTTRRIRHTSQDLVAYDEQEQKVPSRRYGTRAPSRPSQLAQPRLPVTRDLTRDTDKIHEEWEGFIDGDPTLDMLKTEKPLYEEYAERPSVSPTVRRRRRNISSRALVHKRNIGLPERDELPPDNYDPNRVYEEGEELPPGLRVVKRGKTSRRGLLVGVGMGVGVLAVGGVVAVSNLAPKSASQSDHTSRAVQEAFNHGVAQGADSARRELVSALDSLEGFTLQGAIDAAKLTRVAYDVFVSPVVQFGSQLTADFLKAMLNALKTARGWLAGIYQDNATLAAIQRVLESWVDQVSKLPKQLDVITQTDLDGAQAYLTALQRKIADEEKKLDNPQPTPTVPANESTPESKQNGQ